MHASVRKQQTGSTYSKLCPLCREPQDGTHYPHRSDHRAHDDRCPIPFYRHFSSLFSAPSIDDEEIGLKVLCSSVAKQVTNVYIEVLQTILA